MTQNGVSNLRDLTRRFSLLTENHSDHLSDYLSEARLQDYDRVELNDFVVVTIISFVDGPRFGGYWCAHSEENIYSI